MTLTYGRSLTAVVHAAAANFSPVLKIKNGLASDQRAIELFQL